MDPARQRRLLTDLAIVVATACWPLALRQEEVSGDLTWPTGALLWGQVAAATVALVLLAWRRRHPTAVALGILPLSISVFAVVPAMVALYELAARRDRSLALGVAAGYLAATLVGAALLDPPDAWLVHLATMAAFHAVPVALGMVRQARLDLLHELTDRAARAERERSRQVEQARQSERQRIAREMHDVVAHRISLISLHAGALAYRPDAPPGEIVHAAEVVRSSAHEALEELRGVIGVLRDGDDPSVPDRPQPTLADVQELFDRCRAAGTDLVVHDRARAADAVPVAVGRTAYRVLEEGLTNAVKHAPHARVEVTIAEAGAEGLSLEVANVLPLPSREGAPATRTIPGAGAGLIGLAERVALARGRIEHGPTDDGRFRLLAVIPWRS